MAYKDKRGYQREHSNAVHRHRAYHHIYLKNRKKYPLPFEAYEVHHIDGDKNNNRMDNLAILTPEEHDKAHELMDLEIEIFRNFGIPSLDIFEKNISVLMEEFGLTREQVFQKYEDLKKEREEEILENAKKKFLREHSYYNKSDIREWGIDVFEMKGIDVYAPKENRYEFLGDVWKELMKLLENEEEEQEKTEELEKKRKERNEKIKKAVIGFFKKK